MGYYLLEGLAEKAQSFVDAYIQKHRLNEPLRWDALLSVTPQGTLLHVMILPEDRSFVLESRDFIL